MELNKGQESSICCKDMIYPREQRTKGYWISQFTLRFFILGAIEIFFWYVSLKRLQETQEWSSRDYGKLKWKMLKFRKYVVLWQCFRNFCSNIWLHIFFHVSINDWHFCLLFWWFYLHEIRCPLNQIRFHIYHVKYLNLI